MHLVRYLSIKLFIMFLYIYIKYRVFGGKNDENSIALNAANIRGMSLLPEHEQKQQPKVLCMVYTMEENHHTSIRAIRETW